MESKSKDLLLSLDMLYCRRYRGSFYASSDENAMEDIDKNETRNRGTSQRWEKHPF